MIFTPFDRRSGFRSVSGIRPTCQCRCPPLPTRWPRTLSSPPRPPANLIWQRKRLLHVTTPPLLPSPPTRSTSLLAEAQASAQICLAFSCFWAKGNMVSPERIILKQRNFSKLFPEVAVKLMILRFFKFITIILGFLHENHLFIWWISSIPLFNFVPSNLLQYYRIILTRYAESRLWYAHFWRFSHVIESVGETEEYLPKTLKMILKKVFLISIPCQ